MTEENIKAAEGLNDFIKKSPTAFHAVQTISDILDKEGFTCLSEADEWNLKEGGKYYVTRNLSSIIAFTIPQGNPVSFMITASHTDSPMYKLKSECESDAFGKYIKLNVEGYGGMIASTWLDRPLSVAGRVIVKKDNEIKSVLVNIDRDLLIIPNVAIHQNRSVNNGYAFNAAVDMMPLFSSENGRGGMKKLIAEEVGCDEKEILSTDLYLYNRTPSSVFGYESEFFASSRIDNLECAYTTLMGFISSASNTVNTVKIYSSFDNEETGSETKQGAGSGFLHDVISEICDSFSLNMRAALASSFMVSADNGHAKHPNHPELSDSQNAPHLNGGIVIKSNSAQKYTTDALSASVFSEICKNAGVPVQQFANRSDMAGGSTLGSISNTKVSLNTADIGLAQLAMHSSYETAGCVDIFYMIKAVEEFYKTEIKCLSDGVYIIVK